MDVERVVVADTWSLLATGFTLKSVTGSLRLGSSTESVFIPEMCQAREWPAAGDAVFLPQTQQLAVAPVFCSVWHHLCILVLFRRWIIEVQLMGKGPDAVFPRSSFLFFLVLAVQTVHAVANLGLHVDTSRTECAEPWTPLQTWENAKLYIIRTHMTITDTWMQKAGIGLCS